MWYFFVFGVIILRFRWIVLILICLSGKFIMIFLLLLWNLFCVIDKFFCDMVILNGLSVLSKLLSVDLDIGLFVSLNCFWLFFCLNFVWNIWYSVLWLLLWGIKKWLLIIFIVKLSCVLVIGFVWCCFCCSKVLMFLLNCCYFLY